MSVYEKKSQTNNDLCKKHAVKSEKDNPRTVCPSKLSKRELEDLYYSLMENNLELKKTINALNEKNRILSTKVQRMTAHTKTSVDNKDCCAAGKAIINEQKAAIADLTKANEAMADRVRRLSTQLCTAKQFLKQNPNARNCYKCYVNTTTSVKNLSTVSLHNKMSDVNLKSLATSARSGDRDRQEPPSTRTAVTNTSDKDVENIVEKDEKGDAEKVCNENRCRTTMEDFKQKIEELEDELAKTHDEYSSRMNQLENQVLRLQTAAVRARSDHSARAREHAQLPRERAGADNAELEALLAVEKRKVAELEMRLNVAELSQQVARAIEGHLNAANRLEEKQLRQTSIQRYSISSNLATDDESPRRIPATPTVKRLNELTVPEDKLSKSDDSGYAEHRRDSYSDEKNINKTNQELIKKIGELQAQLDAIKLASAKRGIAEPEASPYHKTYIPYDEQWDDAQKSTQSKVTPRRPLISISEPENMQPKKLNSAQADNNITKDSSTISKNERNDVDIDSRPLQNELDNSVKKDIDKNESTHDHDKTGCLTCMSGNKEDTAESYTPKSTDIAVDKDDGSDSKTKRVSSRDHHESEEIKPKTPDGYISDGANTRCLSITQPPKPTNSKDNHNFQQIPGPIPIHSDSASSKQRYRTLASNWKQARSGKRKSNDEVPNKSKTVEIEKTAAVTKDGHLVSNIKKNQDNITSDGESYLSNGAKDLKYDNGKDVSNDGQTKRSVKDEYLESNVKENQDNITSDGESSYNNGAKDLKYDKDKDVTNDGQTKRSVKDGSLDNNVKKNQDNVTSDGESSYSNGANKTKRLVKNVRSSQANKTPQRKNLNDFMLDPEKQLQGNVKGFVTPSGVPTNMKSGQKYRMKKKSLQLDKSIIPGNMGTNQDLDRIDEFGPVLRDAPLGTSTPKIQNNAETPMSPHTYTVDSDGKRSRATSPDNTDNEISVMSDLPTEKEASSPRKSLSPGEHKTTATSTESYSIPNEASLSEGEVPADKYPGRRMSKSIGEASRTDYLMKDNSLGEHKSSSERMEAALEAISQELARCRWLLQSQRTREQSKDVATGLDATLDSLILHRTRGLSRIDGTVVPTCLFVVHIATVVLADQAVIKSRDSRFILTWRFYDSDSTVTPFGFGRVINFHFSTQYYLEMSNEVTKYLRNENMLIVMCEVGSNVEPFATCTLPLQRMLVNANRRVDFTLPLRADSNIWERSSSDLNSRDIGVLDAWCMLHCDWSGYTAANRDSVEPPSCNEQVLEITVLWLTLNENCECMLSNDDWRLYVAYTFLGRDEAELETPISLPKPKKNTDKCIFNFRKCFNLTQLDIQTLKHMVKCFSKGRNCHNSKNCIVFTVVSEPPEDPFGLENCEDIGLTG